MDPDRDSVHRAAAQKKKRELLAGEKEVELDAAVSRNETIIKAGPGRDSPIF